MPASVDALEDGRGAEPFARQPTSLDRSTATSAGVDNAPRPTLKPSAAENAGAAGEVAESAGTQAPDATPMRIFIHRTMGDADAALAGRLAGFLRNRGFTVAGIRAVDFRIDVPSVRYFFDSDRAGSRRLIGAIETFFADRRGRAPEEAADFTHFSPKPRQGNVEVWLPTRGDGWTRSARAAPAS